METGFDDCVVGSQFDIYCLHHPVFRNLDIKTFKHEGRFCGHFPRVVVADFQSLCGDIVSRACLTRLSPVAKIPFQTRIGQADPFQTRRGKKVREGLRNTVVSSDDRAISARGATAQPSCSRSLPTRTLPKPTRPSQQTGRPLLRAFLARGSLRFPVSARRYRLKSLFGASVSGDKNPVPNSTRKKVREGLARQARKNPVPGGRWLEALFE